MKKWIVGVLIAAIVVVAGIILLNGRNGGILGKKGPEMVTYQSTVEGDTWLKVTCNLTDSTYRMWVAMPKSGEWGEPAAEGRFTVENRHNSDDGHVFKAFVFHHTKNSSYSKKQGVESLNTHSSVSQMIDAVKNVSGDIIGKAAEEDMIELLIDDHAKEDAIFKCTVIPVGGTFVADKTDENPWKD